MKKLLIGLVATASLFVAACGGDDDTATTTTAAAAGETNATEAETTEAKTTEAAAPTSAAAPATSTTAAPATSTTAAATTAAPAASGGSLAVVIEDDPWSVKANKTVPAGKISFAVTNEGSFPHEMVVFKGSYADLPKADIGTVLEGELAAGVLVGRTDKIAAGESATLEADLAAGKYSLICNIAAGPNSHAGKGQVLDITVG